jgi:hypothetical protein
MNNTILVAGATGDLGSRVCKQLLQRAAGVKALVRPESDELKVKELRELGVEVVIADYHDEAALVSVCKGISCVVSVLAGLHDVIVGTQSLLLRATVQAGVPRFIPSDFCTDFTQLRPGDNRNFDLRKEFQSVLEATDIRATSIFNGAFAHVLQYGIPLLDTRNKTIACYTDKSDWEIDFTTIEDTAAFTASAALDEAAPRFLRIAGFRVSPVDLKDLTNRVFNNGFDLKDQGSLDEFAGYIKHVRREHPEGELQLYPQWQQMQYLYSMFAAHHDVLDNDRYPGMMWETAEDILKQIKEQKSL